MSFADYEVPKAPKGIPRNEVPLEDVEQETDEPKVTSAARRRRRFRPWRSFNILVIKTGNWFSDNTKKAMVIFQALLSVVLLISAVVCIIEAVINRGWLSGVMVAGMLLLVGLLLWYVGKILIRWVVGLLVYGVRLIFWNAWSFTAIIAITAFLIVVPPSTWFSQPLSHYVKIDPTEIFTLLEDRETDSYVCTVSVLNIRTQPDIHSDIIGVLRKGEHINVEEMAGDFARITYEGQTGYIVGSFIEKDK